LLKQHIAMAICIPRSEIVFEFQHAKREQSDQNDDWQNEKRVHLGLLGQGYDLDMGLAAHSAAPQKARPYQPRCNAWRQFRPLHPEKCPFIMQTQPDITPANWGMVATLGLVWGATFLFIELALTGITPFWLAAGRIGFACLLTTTVWMMRGSKVFLTDETAWGALIISGILNSAIPFMLLSWGQQTVTSGFAGVSMAAVALIVLPLAHIFVPGERMTLRRLIGFGIGFAGVTVLLGGQVFASSGDPLEPFGRLACVGAAACYAVSSVIVRKLPPIDPFGLSALTLVFGSLVVGPAAFIVEGAPVMPETNILLIVAVLGLIPTAGANLLRVFVIRSAGPVFMSLVNYQVPMWSVILGILILGEVFRPILLLAMALILTGLLVSQWGALNRLFGRRVIPSS
jgi:drug/metabolite transporter (DMT)-like permease